MTRALDKRAREKKEREQYREVADNCCKELTDAYVSFQTGITFKLGVNPHIQPMEAGAFIEVIMWIPKERLKDND